MSLAEGGSRLIKRLRPTCRRIRPTSSAWASGTKERSDASSSVLDDSTSDGKGWTRSDE